MRAGKAGNSEGDRELRKPVQAFGSASVLRRLGDGKTYEDHGRSVLILANEPSLRLALAVVAAGRRTGGRRVAGTSTAQVPEGEVGFGAGRERHVPCAGGTLVVRGNVSYDAEIMSGCAFLRTLAQPVERGRGFPKPALPTGPPEGRAGPDRPGTDRAS